MGGFPGAPGTTGKRGANFASRLFRFGTGVL